MMKLVIFFLCLFAIHPLPTQAQEYAVVNIDETLLENASAVIRQDFTEFTVKGYKRSQSYHKLVITILEPKGLAHADLTILYDSFIKVGKLKGTLYDSHGKKIRELRKDEFQDTHAYDGFSVYNDFRVIQTDLYSNQYPFTVEYEYNTSYSSTFYLNQTWSPVKYAGISLEKASIIIDAPADFSFNYSTANFDSAEPQIKETSRNRLEHTWHLNNFNALVGEPYMPSKHHILPYILFSPCVFAHGGYKGNMESWEKFGQWINELNSDRQKLDEATLQHIREITSGLTNTPDKIRAVYEFVQSNTRYVNISLGIGGFQPQQASDVSKNGYGDCKALSNYTVALLDAIGIQSYYTLIRSGESFIQTQPGFPHNYFNHVIVCVPLANDTLWLETTDQVIPAGYFGQDNTNKYVLLATEQGGVLAKTPPANPSRNTVAQKTDLQLHADGTAQASHQKTFHGLAFEERIGLYYMGEKAQKDFFAKNSDINQLIINHLSLNMSKIPEPMMIKEVDFIAQNYSRKAGDRLVFQPLLLHRSMSTPANTAKRINDFELNNLLSYQDSVFWQLPKEYHIHHLPDNVFLDTPFGSYQLKYDYQPEARTLAVNRSLMMKSGYFQAKEYEDFITFLRTVQQNDRNSLMLSP